MWSEGLRERGHEVRVLQPSDYECLPESQIARKFRQAYGAWRTLTRLSLAEYDLIEFYGDEFWLATWWLSQRRARPLLVAHTNGLELLAAERARASVDEETNASIPRQLLSRLTHERFSPIAFRRADAFVTLCELDRRYVVNHRIQSFDNTAVIPPGVDDEFLSVANEGGCERRVVFFGSWTPRKGLRELQTVMTAVLRKYADVIFDVLGAASSATVIYEAFPVDVHARIVIHPRLSNQELARLLSRCSILFFPSLYEGFGMAIAEAMACGCAVVTTPTGYGAELVDGDEALIFPFGDVGAMQAALERLLIDDALRARIATAGQRRARTLRWETSVAKLDETYSRWIAEDRQTRPR